MASAAHKISYMRIFLSLSNPQLSLTCISNNLTECINEIDFFKIDICLSYLTVFSKGDKLYVFYRLTAIKGVECRACMYFAQLRRTVRPNVNDDFNIIFGNILTIFKDNPRS